MSEYEELRNSVSKKCDQIMRLITRSFSAKAREECEALIITMFLLFNEKFLKIWSKENWIRHEVEDKTEIKDRKHEEQSDDKNIIHSLLFICCNFHPT